VEATAQVDARIKVAIRMFGHLICKITINLVDAMGVGSGGVGPWIFIHGPDIVNRGLIVLFFDLCLLFSVFFPLAFR